MPDVPLSTRPLHLQLREVLIRRIADGQWRPGEAIPNEIELAREFGLSAGTVRKALDWMESAQLVVRQQGRGTFVRDQTSTEVSTRFSSFRNRDGSMLDDTVVDAEISQGEADAREAERLKLGAGEQVYRIAQTRLVAGEPFAYEFLVLPAALFPRLTPASPGVRSIGETAFANGLLLGTGQESVAIGTANEPAQLRLGLDAQQPVLMLDRVINSIDDRPAEWRRSWCNMQSRIYLARLG